MNILLDTNILIPLEDTSKLLDPNLSSIKQLCSKYNYNIFIHPLQIEDLSRDKNKKGQIVFVHETIVNGQAKTLEEK